MDRKKKIVFIGLGGIAVLYFVALGTGIAVNKGKDGGKPGDLGAMQDTWISALGPLLSSFAPRLDLTGLECNGKRVAAVFELNEQKPTCTIGIPGNREEDYRKTELRVIGTEPGVYVRARFDGTRFAISERDKKTCFLDGEPLPPPGLRLKIEYSPAADDDLQRPWECWLAKDPSEPVPLTVMTDGGDLTLTCEGCKAQQQRLLRLKLE